MRTILILMAFVALPFSAFGGEARVYTDQDLEKYSNYSTYDEETTIQREADFKRWEKGGEIQERHESETREAEDKQNIENKQTSTRKLKVTQKTTKEPANNLEQTVKKRRT